MDDNYNMVIKITDSGIEYLEQRVSEEQHHVSMLVHSKKYYGEDTTSMIQRRNVMIKK